MSEMVERIARALWEQRRKSALANPGIELEEWGDGSIPKANGVFEEARAAIEAMREPTEAMTQIGHHDDMTFADIWRAMIDAA